MENKIRKNDNLLVQLDSDTNLDSRRYIEIALKYTNVNLFGKERNKNYRLTEVYYDSFFSHIESSVAHCAVSLCISFSV